MLRDEGANTADMMSETDFGTGLDPGKIRATMRVILKTRDSWIFKNNFYRSITRGYRHTGVKFEYACVG